MVQRRDGLALDNGRLVGATPTATRALSEAVTAALHLVAGGGSTAAPEALELPRPSNASALRVVVVPCATVDAGVGRAVGASAAVFVSDPEADVLDDLSLVAQLFHLTPTEARVAARLVNGETVQEMAAALELSTNTVRWHLKHVLQKADAKTQAQFVSRVLRSPAWLKRAGQPAYSAASS